MPHTNGKIYSEVVNGVKKGINTDDVGAVIGDSSNDVKTLCLSKKINPAAVFRPRYMGGAVHIAPEDFQSRLKTLAPPSSGNTYVTMECVKYGIWVPRFNRLDQGAPYYASQVRWNPRPCDKTQFGDLTHFDGYDHKAKFTNPVQSIVCAGGSRIQVTFCDSSTSESITAKTLFSDNEDAYFGFIVYEYTGEGPVLSGAGAVTPRIFISSYELYMANNAQVVSSNFNASLGKGYDIIPIVAIGYGMDTDTGQYADFEYYGLRISDTVPGFIRKHIGTNDIEFVYFRYAEGTFYPDGDVAETGTPIGVDKTTFGFALMMTSPRPKILADSDTAYSTGLIRPTSIKLNVKFKPQSSTTVYSKDFTEANGGLTVLRQHNTNILRMYIPTTSTGNKVYDWLLSSEGPGMLAGDFDFEISVRINVNTSGSYEDLKFPATSWMATT